MVFLLLSFRELSFNKSQVHNWILPKGIRESSFSRRMYHIYLVRLFPPKDSLIE